MDYISDVQSNTENKRIAAKLREMAEVLRQQDANPFRIEAYDRAAEAVRACSVPVADIYRDKGHDGLVAVPAIGERIASAIEEMLTTGKWTALDRVTGTLEPEQLFRTVPGIGPKLAERIHDTLHVDTLESLEAAAHDGRLEHVSGVGARRAASIRAVLSERLARPRSRLRQVANEPAVDVLLNVDREYREKAQAGSLPMIAPKRFNPTGEKWLPILHTTHGDWEFTALYSNTGRAHTLGRTRDWVVIYFHNREGREAMRTVVTERRGALAGFRVVRGREGDCATYHAQS